MTDSKTQPKFTVCILAGGESSRMGSDKGFCEIHGSSMIERVIHSVKKTGCQIIIVSNNSAYEKLGYPVFPDLIPKKGPMGGIYTALKNSTTEKNIVLSCDSPFVNSSVIERIMNESLQEEIAIASFENKLYPLIGIYSKTVIQDILNAIKQDQLKLTRFCKNQEMKIIPFEIGENKVTSYTFENINTPEELARINELNLNE